MRLDSPFVLAFCGTVAVHIMLLTAGDALVVTNPRVPSPPAPVVELFDVEVPAPKPPPPPPPTVKEEVIEEEVVPQKQAPPQKVAATQPKSSRPRTSEPPPDNTPPPPATSDDSGGAPVVKMADLVPTQNGVPVEKGPSNNGKRTGRGGKGGGTGTGEGKGAADLPPPPPVSVATIKTAAKPKGEYGYIDAGRDYPPEARRLSIEGVIRVRLLVDATGKVQTAALLNRLGHGLDELALTKAKQIQFDPAKDTDDRAVASTVVWTFNMTLPK